MSELPDFDFEQEVQALAMLVPYDTAADVAWKAEQRTEDVASQAIVLGALSEAGDSTAVYVSRFLTARPDYDLSDCLRAVEVVISGFGPSSHADPAEFPVLYRLRSLQDCIRFAQAIADERRIEDDRDATDRKRSLQAEIYTSDRLTDVQKERYAIVADQLLPGEGLPPDSPDIARYALAADAAYEAFGRSADLAARLRARLPAILAARNVVMHDDIDGLRVMLWNYIKYESTQHAPLYRQMLEAKAAAMEIDSDTLDLIISDLRNIRGNTGG